MAVLGYASQTSVRQGNIIHFHLGHDHGGSTEQLTLTAECLSTRAISQNISVLVEPRTPPSDAPWEGYDWPVTVSLPIPREWPSGLYQLADNSNNPVLFFVVLPRRAGASSKILLQLSWLTPAAYNWRDNISFYKPEDENGPVARARKVSLNRPLPNPNPSVVLNYANELKLIQWLNDNNIIVEYCTSIDLHSSPALLNHYDCLVIAYHDEYWTKAMRDHCESFIANGGNFIVLSGNTCFRQVRLEDNNRTVVFYKYAGLDPTQNTEEAAIAWAEPPVNRPQNTLLGVGFTDGAIFGNYTPYRFRFTDHWVFKGVRDTATPPFMSYETDAANFVDEAEGYPRVTGKEGTPLNTTILASADMSSWQKPGRATMTLFSRNGAVFNAATTEWVENLYREPFSQITRNVFNKLKSPIPRNWELIGHANHASAMTASSEILFLSTTENGLWRRFPVGADVPWRKIGHANHVIAMASDNDTLFCITSDNTLWWRPTLEAEASWGKIGSGPANGTKALAAAGGQLYAIDNNGAFYKRPCSREEAIFTEQRYASNANKRFAAEPTIRAMTSYNGMLIASTTDNRLLRTNRDLIFESDAWHHFHHCNFSIGLAVIEWMLFVVTTDNWLWRLDLTGLKQP